jgi:hypothetical protein
MVITQVEGVPLIVNKPAEHGPAISHIGTPDLLAFDTYGHESRSCQTSFNLTITQLGIGLDESLHETIARNPLFHHSSQISWNPHFEETTHSLPRMPMTICHREEVQSTVYNQTILIYLGTPIDLQTSLSGSPDLRYYSLLQYRQRDDLFLLHPVCVQNLTLRYN